MKLPTADLQLLTARQDAKSEVNLNSSFGVRSFQCRHAFTLIEVMLALGIFFMCMFAILGLICNSLRGARMLQRKTLDCGPLAALTFFDLSNTNQVDEGDRSVDLDDFRDFEGNAYIEPIVCTNGLGLYQVNLTVRRKSGRVVESEMTILVFPEKNQKCSSDGRGTR